MLGPESLESSAVFRCRRHQVSSTAGVASRYGLSSCLVPSQPASTKGSARSAGQTLYVPCVSSDSLAARSSASLRFSQTWIVSPLNGDLTAHCGLVGRCEKGNRVRFRVSSRVALHATSSLVSVKRTPWQNRQLSRHVYM